MLGAHQSPDLERSRIFMDGEPRPAWLVMMEDELADHDGIIRILLAAKEVKAYGVGEWNTACVARLRNTSHKTSPERRRLLRRVRARSETRVASFMLIGCLIRRGRPTQQCMQERLDITGF
jgi:hypothetical protein